MTAAAGAKNRTAALAGLVLAALGLEPSRRRDRQTGDRRGSARGLTGGRLARARPRRHAIHRSRARTGRGRARLARGASARCQYPRARPRALFRWSRDPARARQLRRAVGRSGAPSSRPRRGACRGGIHRRCRCRCALRTAAGSRCLCTASRISRRFSGRARSALTSRVARTLLRDGGCRTRRLRRERRDRDVCSDRPRAAPARSQRRAGGTCAPGNRSALEPAARQRRDGLLRSVGAPGTDSLDAHRGRRAASGAHADRGAAHQ